MKSTNICYLVERAVATFLRGCDLLEDLPVYEGIYQPNPNADEHETKDYPHIVVACQEAVMTPDIGFNWLATVAVSVVSNADDTSAATHHQRVTAVYDWLVTDTLAQDMTDALDDFTAFLVVPQRQLWEIEDRSWKSTYEFQTHCCGSDIREE